MLVNGDSFRDHRGVLSFVNGFDLQEHGIRRFYTMENVSVETFRAWQGHRHETKYFYAVKGSFRIAWVEVDNWETPSPELPVHETRISVQKNGIVCVKPGHANGIQALEPGAVLLIFSDKTLEEAQGDNYKFLPETWKLP